MQNALRERGQAVVELALIMTLLGVVAVAATNFALGVSQYMQVVNAANAAAQYASSGTSQSTNTSQISSVAKADLGSLYPPSGGSITSSTSDDGTGQGLKEVRVTVAVPYQLTIPFAGYFLPSLTLSTTAVMRVDPYAG